MPRLTCDQKKATPFLGPLIKEAEKAGMSGKTIQGAVLATSTANRELSRTLEESEGHLLSAASFVPACGAFAAPKIPAPMPWHKNSGK